MNQKPCGAMLRGKFPYAALSLALKSLYDVPPIADNPLDSDDSLSSSCRRRWQAKVVLDYYASSSTSARRRDDTDAGSRCRND
eukprot:6196069-Pleurochrysis_carterae.AAC.2